MKHGLMILKWHNNIEIIWLQLFDLDTWSGMGQHQTSWGGSWLPWTASSSGIGSVLRPFCFTIYSLIIFPREQLTQLESGSTHWSNLRSPLESLLREGTRWDLYSSIYWQGGRGLALFSCLSWQGGARFPDPLALRGLEPSRSKWVSEPG